MRGRRLWVLNLSLLVLSLILMLGLAELVVRLIAPQPTGLSHQDRFGLALHYPGITRFLPQYGHSVSFNSVGMRDREHPVDKPPGTYRILLLGDSFMEALQVPFEESLPSQLEEDLGRNTGRRIEVIVGGVSGWGTDDELRYLTMYGLKYQPDLIVVAMTLHNDISDNLRRDWHTMRNGVLEERAPAPMSFWQYEIVELKAFLATRFQLYQLWRRVRHGGEMRQTGRQLNSHIVQLFHQPTPPRIEEGFQLTELVLQEMKKVVDVQGAKLALVLLPLRVQLSDSSFAEFVRSAGASPDQMSIGVPQNRLKTVAAGLGVPVIDLLPGFRQWSADHGPPLYLEWDGHWNKAGHRLAASIVVEGLDSLSGLLEATPIGNVSPP